MGDARHLDDPSTDGWVVVASSADLAPGTPHPVQLDGRRLVLWRRPDGRPVLLDDQCVHQGGWLSEGWVDGDLVVCPLHQWAFDATGTCVHIPANRGDVPIPDEVRVGIVACLERDGAILART